MNKAALFVPLLGFLLLGILLGVAINKESKPDSKQMKSVLIGRELPSFSLEKLEASEVKITESNLIGKVSLINFWGTWCPACKFEHPYLVKLSSQNILPIYGINYRDDRDAAISELKAVGDPYKINIYDHNGSLGIDMGVSGAPETFIIDHNGIIQFRYQGPIVQEVWNNKLYPIVQKLQLAAQADGAQ